MSNDGVAHGPSFFLSGRHRPCEQLVLFVVSHVDLISIKYRDFAGFLPGDSVIVGLPNYNLSASYKISKDLGTYVTYNYSQNPVGAVGNGGGFTTGGRRNFSNAALRGEATRALVERHRLPPIAMQGEA